jgi:hypothetical protein
MFKHLKHYVQFHYDNIKSEVRFHTSIILDLDITQTKRKDRNGTKVRQQMIYVGTATSMKKNTYFK